MLGRKNQDEQIGRRDNMICTGTSSDNIDNPTQVNDPQVDVHTLQKNIVTEVRTEVDNMMTSVKNSVQDALLTAIENLVTPRVELAMKAANAPSGWSVADNILEPDQRDFFK